jgi:hypothetical protein
MASMPNGYGIEPLSRPPRSIILLTAINAAMENQKMFTKIALAAALTLGTACAALAAPDTDPTGGFREEGAGGIVRDGVNPVYHPSLRGVAGKAYGYAPGFGLCAQRFKSYDAATGTYLGANGVRHTCS